MLHQNFLGQAQLAADLADFVFEQIAQRLDQSEGHVRGQAADVVVRLDDCGRAFHGDGFDHVRIERSLHQKFHGQARGICQQLALLLHEHGNKFVADDFAFLFGVGDARQLAQETLGSIHTDDGEAQAVAQQFQRLAIFVARAACRYPRTR